MHKPKKNKILINFKWFGGIMGLIEETQGSFLTLITKSSGNVGDPALRRLVGCARDECHRVLE